MTDLIRVEGCRLPLGQSGFSQVARPGTTVADIVRQSGLPEGEVLVQIDGRPLDRSEWHRFAPPVGSLVNLSPQAGWGVVIGVLIATALSITASFLLAPDAPSGDAPDRTDRIQGGTNALRPWEPLPVLFGRMRYAPPAVNAWVPYQSAQSADVFRRTGYEPSQYLEYPEGTVLADGMLTFPNGNQVAAPHGTLVLDNGRVAQPFAPVGFLSGTYGTFAAQVNKQWVRTLLFWGLGTIDVSGLRIGNTPVEDYGDGVAFATAVGANDDFPEAVRRIDVGADLNGAATVRRRLGLVESSATVNLVWPSGLFRSNNKGEIHGFDEPHGRRLERRPVPLVLRLETPDGVTLDSVEYNAVGGTQERPLHVSRTLTVGEPQEVVLSVERKQAARKDFKFNDDLQVESVVIPTTSAPVVGLTGTTTSVRIQATEQISGTVPTISGIGQAHHPDWDADSDAWVVRETRNPASAFRAVLTGAGNARPVEESRLLDSKLREWHEWCESEGFTYDAVHMRGGSVDALLGRIAAAGRARPAWIDGRRGVLMDRAQAHRRQVFTPHNIRQVRVTRVIAEVPHMLRCRFRDEDEDYEVAEVRVYRPGYDQTNAVLTEQRTLDGVTRRDTVSALLAYQLRSQMARREQYVATTDWEHLVATIGDRVALLHDAIENDAISGRVLEVSVAGLAANELAARFDNPGGLDFGLAWTAIVRTRDDATLYVVREPDDADDAAAGWVVLQHVSARPSVTAGDMIGCYRAGTGIEECLLESVQPQADAAARLTLVQYGGDRVFSAQSGYTVEYVDPIGDVRDVPFGSFERARITNTVTLVRTIYNEGLDPPGRPDGEEVPDGWTESTATVRHWVSRQVMTVYPNVTNPPQPLQTIGGVSFPVGSEVDAGPWSVPELQTVEGWLTGDRDPTPDDGEDGQFWLNKATRAVFERVAGEWVLRFDAPDTARWLTGEGPPGNSLGEDGQFYLERANGRVHFRAAGAWVSVLQGSSPRAIRLSVAQKTLRSVTVAAAPPSERPVSYALTLEDADGNVVASATAGGHVLVVAHEFGGLDVGTRYTARIHAVYQDGNGPEDVLVVTTNVQEGYEVVGLSRTEIRATVPDAGDGATYEWRVDPGADPGSVVWRDAGTTTVPTIDIDLTALYGRTTNLGFTVECRVTRAGVAGGWSFVGWSSTHQHPDAPGQPQNPVLAVIAATAVFTIDWDAPATVTPGHTIVRYGCRLWRDGVVVERLGRTDDTTERTTLPQLHSGEYWAGINCITEDAAGNRFYGDVVVTNRVFFDGIDPNELIGDEIGTITAYQVTEGGLTPNKPTAPVNAQIADRILTSDNGWVYPRPAHNPNTQQIWQTTSVDLENWSDVRLAERNFLTIPLYRRAATLPERPPNHPASPLA